MAVLFVAGYLSASGCKTSQSSGLQSDPLKGQDNRFQPGPNFPRRLENRSPEFALAADGVKLHADFAYQSEGGRREFQLGIKAKTMQMIRDAESLIVGSYFLFDCMYPNLENPSRVPAGSPQTPDFVEQITTQLIEKKIANDNIKIIWLLDPINRTYKDRIGPQIKRLVEAGVVVLYSDLASTPDAANFWPPEKEVLGPILSQKTFKIGAAESAQTAAVKKIAEKHRQLLTYSQLQEQFISPAMEQHLEPAVEAIRRSYVGAMVPFQLPSEEVVRVVKQGGAVRTSNGQPVLVDNEPVNLEFIYNILLLKANHRKILLTDSTAGDQLEALVGSANPHNASLPSANFAISVQGALANYIYRVVREDVIHSAERAWLHLRDNQSKRDARQFLLESRLADGTMGFMTLDQVTALMPEEGYPIERSSGEQQGGVRGVFVTESKIKDVIIEVLGDVEPGDEVRLQMFYLSDVDVVEAIVKAAARLQDKPLRLILDPNRDAFGREKDGTPNRQVAEYLFGTTGGELNPSNLAIRWYNTQGEQNHAKILSVTNAKRNKYVVLTGSANWTGKNIGGANMESNLLVRGSAELTTSFNELFDAFWSNRDGPTGESRIFTLPYDTPPYNQPVDDGRKWLVGEATGLVAW